MTKNELRILNGAYAYWERLVKAGMEAEGGSKALEEIKIKELFHRQILKALGLEVDSPVWPSPPEPQGPLTQRATVLPTARAA